MAPHPATGVASARLSCAKYPVSVALNALAPDRSVPVHAQPTVAPLKPCEPARYPPLQVERMLLTAARFTPMADSRRAPVWGRLWQMRLGLPAPLQPSRKFRRGVLAAARAAIK